MHKTALILIAAALVISVPAPAMAGGVISPGVLHIERSNHLWTGDTARLSSLDANAETATKTIPMLMLEVHLGYSDEAPLGSGFSGRKPDYAYRETYIGVPPSEWGEIGYGVKDYTPARGLINWFIHITPYKEVWENPYLSGLSRIPTGSTVYGGKLAWEVAMGSGMNMELKANSTSVDNDLLARTEPDLARDGAEYSLKLSYSIEPSDRLTIEPGIETVAGMMDGEANSYSSVTPSLEIKHITKKLITTMILSAGSRDYDKAHPVFGQTRQEDTSGAMLFMVFPGAFGNKDRSMTFGAAYSKTDSNITFFDTQSTTAFVSLGFRI